MRKDCYMSSCTEFEAILINVDGNTPIITIMTIREIASTLDAIGAATLLRSSGSVQNVNRTIER